MIEEDEFSLEYILRNLRWQYFRGMVSRGLIVSTAPGRVRMKNSKPTEN